jgi:hypothetical protein
VGPRGDLDAVAKRKNVCPLQELNPRDVARLVAQPLEQHKLHNTIYYMGGACSTNEMRNAYSISVGKPDHSEDLGVVGWKILDWIFGK